MWSSTSNAQQKIQSHITFLRRDKLFWALYPATLLYRALRGASLLGHGTRVLGAGRTRRGLSLRLEIALGAAQFRLGAVVAARVAARRKDPAGLV